MDVKARDHVVEHAELLEQADLLEGSRDAEPHAPVRGHSREIARRLNDSDPASG